MNSVPVMWMRGGTSKGGYFLASDVPSDEVELHRFLLRVMGSPDERQIDGMGGAGPLTSKVAVVRKSDRENVDVDYHFYQVFVEEALVSDAQNCGNLLAGIGPFAIDRGLVAAEDGETAVSIFMENTNQVAVAKVQTPGGLVSYEGDAHIDGVPGTAAPVPLEFQDTAGSMCGALLPTGNVVDTIRGVPCTLIDNGMPCIVIGAADVGATGYESREELEDAKELKANIEAIRLAAGPMMKLADVSEKSVPKMMLVAPPQGNGAISVRSYIPHRAHAGIGVFAAVTVATAALLEGTPAATVARIPSGLRKMISIEHPSGETTCVMEIEKSGAVKSAAMLRTARKLMDGKVYV